jgi:hypothetical protein
MSHGFFIGEHRVGGFARPLRVVAIGGTEEQRHWLAGPNFSSVRQFDVGQRDSLGALNRTIEA